MPRVASGTGRARIREILALCAVLVVVLGACQSLVNRPAVKDTVAHPYPAGCAAFELSARRCEAIVTELASRAKVDLSEVKVVDLLGDPGCPEPSGQATPCTPTGAFVVRVRFTSAGGIAREESVFCGAGGEHTILCTDSPEIARTSATMGGAYRELACTGEPPAGCPTPLPRIDATSAAREHPLRIAARDIRLDHLGGYRIALGTGTLANGILEQASFSLANAHPTTFYTTQDGVRLELTSLERGAKPFINGFDHGWRKGVERFSATLVFSISWFSPGAVLQVRNIVVH
jgi:hypothetical protein